MSTSKREYERQTIQLDTLRSLGFKRNEAESLRRISMTLHRWFELECGTDNGCIERDEVTNKPYWLNSMTGKRSYAMADREAGAMKRLAKIIEARNNREWHPIMPEAVSSYIQGDCRGAALYILRPGDVPQGKSADSYYSRGICVY